MIEATGLSKRFGTLTAVDDFSIVVPSGQIFGLLGPNAAGKTTTIRMLCGILQNDQGEVRINGLQVDQAKHDFGYVAQHFGQYEELTVWENLRFYAEIYGVKDLPMLADLLARYQLTPYKNKPAGTLSGGYKRRLALVCALAHDPQVLFLDEPTAGIDPTTRKLLWDDFYKLSAAGKTLFVTTHYMEEAQRCHQLAFLSRGSKVAEGTPSTIKDALGDTRALSARIGYDPQIRDALVEMKGVLLVNQFGDELRVICDAGLGADTLQILVAGFTGETVDFVDTETNLEDVFIALTRDPSEPVT